MEALTGKSSKLNGGFSSQPYLITQGEMDHTIWYYSPGTPQYVGQHNPLRSSTKGGFELDIQHTAHMYFSDIKYGWCHLCNRKSKHGTRIKAVTSQGNYELQKNIKTCKKIGVEKQIWGFDSQKRMQG